MNTLVISDVRNVPDGKRLNTKSQQKIGVWSHGRQRRCLTYTNVFACQEVQPEGKHMIRFP